MGMTVLLVNRYWSEVDTAGPERREAKTGPTAIPKEQCPSESWGYGR